MSGQCIETEDAQRSMGSEGWVGLRGSGGSCRLGPELENSELVDNPPRASLDSRHDRVVRSLALWSH